MTDGPEFSNRQVPEGISSGHEHPLVDFAKSISIMLAFMALIMVLIFFFGRSLTVYIPFSWEKSLFDASPPITLSPEQRNDAVEARVRALAERVTASMDLPAGMTITVHYVDDDTLNAFATLGGHVVIHGGLWRLIESENTAAMLLAHEIAHVKNRDPVRSASTSLLLSIVTHVLLGDTGMVGDLASTANRLSTLYFSREQETEADENGAAALMKLYGHLDGATALFEILKGKVEERGRKTPPAFLSTHPHLDERIDAIRRLATENNWPLRGKAIPLR